LSVEFRHPIGDRRELNASERRHLRRATRFRESLSWLARKLGINKPNAPSATVNDDPVQIARFARGVLGISSSDQKRWATPSAAFDAWRAVLETSGYTAFLFSIGKDSCRGFSLWDKTTPIVAVNTSWNEFARILTLFHEFAHLITRTSSACVESLRTSPRTAGRRGWDGTVLFCVRGGHVFSLRGDYRGHNMDHSGSPGKQANSVRCWSAWPR